jgi:hypothetical protein
MKVVSKGLREFEKWKNTLFGAYRILAKSHKEKEMRGLVSLRGQVLRPVEFVHDKG